MQNKLLIAALLASIQAHAASFNQCQQVHTWHNVTSQTGQWQLTLSMINQEGAFWDEACNTINRMDINPAKPLVYGFSFSDKADFDLAYTLTAVQIDPAFKSKACVFVVTAKGPAKPDIQSISYYGADCQWQVVHGVGENFSVG